jgi:hypothetical protein
LSGIQPHDPSNQPAKTHASDRTAIVTGTPAHSTEKSLYCNFTGRVGLYAVKELKLCEELEVDNAKDSK